MEVCTTHRDVATVTMKPLQMSNGTTQFRCNICSVDIVKSIRNDVDFIREYKRYHKLCVDHETRSVLGSAPADHVEDREYIPTYKNEKGNLACNWCGETLL